MRILVVSQYFWPENFRINDLCAELSKRGHEVTILTAKPNYPAGDIFQEYKDSPKIYNDYKDCKVVRVPIIPRGQNALTLMLNYLSYPILASTFGLYKLRKQEFDLVFVFQLSPVFLAIPAIVYRAVYKKPVVMWVLDLWPDTLKSVKNNIRSTTYRLISWIVSKIYNRCDVILGQSESFTLKIKQRSKHSTLVKFMPNWSEDIFSKTKIIEGFETNIELNKDIFKVLFAGNVGEAQDFPAIIKAASLVKDAKLNIRIYIVGDGRELDYVKNQIVKAKLNDTLILLGRHSLEYMPKFYSQSDALLVSLKESDAFSMTIPGKLQSYMSAGKPVITMLNGEGSQVVESARCGLTNKSGDFQGLANSIIKMSKMTVLERKELAENGLSYSQLNFSRSLIIDAFEETLTQVIKDKG